MSRVSKVRGLAPPAKRNGKSRRGGNPRHRKTVDKADKVEVRKASTAAATQFDLPLEDAIERHLKLIKKEKDKLTTQSGVVRNAYKTAKTEKVNKKLIDFLFSLERGDAHEMREELEAMALGLRTVGAPFRIVVFDAIFKNAEDQAKAEGTFAASKGKPAEPRYEEGTPAHEAYMEAYMIEQAKRTPGAEQLSLAELKQAVKDGQEAGAAKH